MSRGAWIVSVVVLACLVPSVVAAAPPPPMPTPPQSNGAREPRWALLAMGVFGVAAGYGLANAMAAERNKEEASGWLRVPLVGPTGYYVAHDDRGDFAIFSKVKNLALTTGLTSLQLGGAVLAGIGLWGKKTETGVEARIAPGFVGVGGAF